MKNLLKVSAILMLSTYIITAKPIDGFFCDFFNDMGTGLGGTWAVPTVAFLGLREEGIKTSSNKTLQSSIMVENTNDVNGVLLYPDGQPRFALIYSHGGVMSHSNDLQEKGRKNVRDHYYHGGSHVGSCAGSYMLSSMQTTYYNIWSGSIDMSEFNAGGTTTDCRIPKESPLLKYGFDFGGDSLVAKVRLNNGGSVLLNMPNKPVPPGTEILSLHENVPINPKMTGHCSCWGWKGKDTTGRVIGICPHPESNADGEIRDYMASILLHAIAGMAKPPVKGTLDYNAIRLMNKSTGDNDPAYTKIGDLQYHHFIIDLKTGVENFSLTLQGKEGYDFNLYLKKDSYALDSCADYKQVGPGAQKTITVAKLDKGLWYTGVKGMTTVTSTKKTVGSDTYYEYTGKLEVLNGVDYSIKATWDVTNIWAVNNISNPEILKVTTINKKIVINVHLVKSYTLAIFDLKGRVYWTQDSRKSVGLHEWTPVSPGMYFLRMESGKNSLVRRITVER
jgi:hypothetical protein